MKQEKEVKLVRDSAKRIIRMPVKIAGEMAGDFMKGVSLGWGAQSKVVKGKCPFCGK